MRSIVTGASPVDPQRFKSSLAALADPSWRARLSGLIDAAATCSKRLLALDFAPLERRAAGETALEVWGSIDATMAALWLAVEELQQVMQPLTAAHDVRHQAAALAAGASGAPGEPLVDFGEELALEAAPSPVGAEAPSLPTVASRVPTPEERVSEAVWAMSFVLAGEIDSFRRRLPTLLKLPDAWELVGSLQDHLGHLQSAIGAICTGIVANLPGTAEDDGAEASQGLFLLTSRELRSSIFALRDDVLALEAKLRAAPAQEWLPHLRALQKLVDDFMFSAAFGWMRIGDKRSFLAHQRALSELLSLWSPLRAPPARQAVSGMARYLEALELINHRECLVVHDRAALREAAANLRAAQAQQGGGGRAAFGRALSSLSLAQGRDKVIDELLAAILDPAAPVRLEAILARVEEVLAKLG